MTGWLSHLVSILNRNDNYGIVGFSDFAVPRVKESREVDWMMFTCVLVRGNIFIQIPRFDERMFTYYSDTLFQWKARELGWKIFASNENLCQHLPHGSSQFLNNYPEILARDKRFVRE